MVEDTFLGRERWRNAREALLAASSYVAENPAPGREALPASAVRALLVG